MAYDPTGTPTPPARNVPSTVVIALIGAMSVGASLVAAVIVSNHDPAQLIYFYGASLPSVIGIVAVSRKVDKVGQIAETTQQKLTNGLIPEKVNEALDAREQHATDAADHGGRRQTDPRDPAPLPPAPKDK